MHLNHIQVLIAEIRMTKILIGFLSLSPLFCSMIFAAEMQNIEKEHYVFIGNPGVGKSAIINALVGKKVFQSGLSVGTGLTKYLQSYEHNGKVYIDTPGLADLEQKAAAAKEIEKALKMGGRYRLFFVFNLNELRITEQDLVTLELVLDAIDHPEKKFNIIINKIEDDEREELKNPDQLAALLYLLRKQKYNTDAIWFLDRDRELRFKRIEFLPLDQKTQHFIFNLSQSMNINNEIVQPIQWDKYEELKRQTTQTISSLEQKIKDNDGEIIKLKDDLKKALDDNKSKNTTPTTQQPAQQPTIILLDRPATQQNSNQDFFHFLENVANIGITLFSLLG